MNGRILMDHADARNGWLQGHLVDPPLGKGSCDLPPTPIIALTALALKGEAAKIVEAGCNIHIIKPVKKATLLEVLQAHKGRVV